ncbi:hypothetical protein X943_003759 [Babesia divergens]|uniref:RNA-binding S4 domain-containing protein n=1 Tax=Babesia divergens TaxID=32595 RepID=A0AAD9GGG1_BABDI|nr:hypothetical protein X943_003759 [Babesia divergens]
MTLTLSTFCAQKGICSKKDAKKYIQLGYIQVNNKIVKEDFLVKNSLNIDAVKLLKRVQYVTASKISILLHKPEGYISTFNRRTELWAKSLLTPENRCEDDVRNGVNPSQLRKLLPINPLEYAASGLALFSEDRSLSNRFNECEEEYYVVFRDVLTGPKLFVLRSDIHIGGIALPPLKVNQLSDYSANITIQGSSSKLRKACQLAGLDIRLLKRVRMANLQLGNLLCGQWIWLRRYHLT